MILFGASGHSKVIIDIIRSIGSIDIDFIVDDNIHIKEVSGLKVDHIVTPEMAKSSVLIAIGNNKIRKKIVNSNNYKFTKAFCHKNAVVNMDVEIGEGSVVMAGAVINPSVNIGKHCIINTNAVVEHDVEILDYCHISPGAVITGNVTIGEGTHVGAGATVIPGIKIGSWVTIGAGAVIINNVPDNAVVVGNPGKIIKYNKCENE